MKHSLQPEPLPIVDQELEGRAAPVAKQKHRPRKRIVVEAVTAQRGERINAFAEIDRLVSKHDLKLWGKLDHDLGAQKSCAEGFELDRINGAQMKRQTRAVGTLEEHSGGRIKRRCVAGHKC